MPGLGRRPVRRARPVDRERADDGRRRHLEDALAAVDAADAAAAGWAETSPRERGGDPAPRLRADDRAGRPPGAADHRWRTARRWSTPGARSPTPRSSSAGTRRRRSARPGEVMTAPSGANKILVLHQPVGHLRAGDAVELPGRHGHPQDRPCPGRGVHRRPQAGQRHPADRPGDGPDPRRGGRAGRGRQRAARPPVRRRGLGDAARLRGCASCRSPAAPRWAGSC